MINEDEFRIIENLGSMKAALTIVENVISTQASKDAWSKETLNYLTSTKFHLRNAIQQQQYQAEEILKGE